MMIVAADKIATFYAVAAAPTNTLQRYNASIMFFAMPPSEFIGSQMYNVQCTSTLYDALFDKTFN